MDGREIRVDKTLQPGALARFPIGWNHPIDKKSRQISVLEQVLIEKACQLFRNLL